MFSDRVSIQRTGRRRRWARTAATGRVGVHAPLRAEAAAHPRGADPDRGPVDAERAGHLALDAEDALRGDPHRERTVLLREHEHAVRLHGHRRDAVVPEPRRRHGVGRAEEVGLGVVVTPSDHVGAVVGEQDRSVGTRGRHGVDDRGGGGRCRPRRARRHPCRPPGPRRGPPPPVRRRTAPGPPPGAVGPAGISAHGRGGQVGGGPDRVHPGEAGRVGHVDRAEHPVGDRRADEHRVEHPRRREVGDEPGRAGEQLGVLRAADLVAEQGASGGRDGHLTLRRTPRSVVLPRSLLAPPHLALAGAFTLPRRSGSTGPRAARSERHAGAGSAMTRQEQPEPDGGGATR